MFGKTVRGGGSEAGSPLLPRPVLRRFENARALLHTASGLKLRFSGLRAVYIALFVVVGVFWSVGFVCRGAEECVFEVFSLPLRGSPSTGYSWSWTATGDGEVSETGMVYSRDEEFSGMPGMFVYSFVGEREGDVELRFVYSRTEPALPDDRVALYRCRVLSDLRIMMLEMREGVIGGLPIR